MPRQWREWFIPQEEDIPEASQLDQVRSESGAGHRDEEYLLDKLKKKTPRCAGCKRYMGYEDGMYITVTEEWRIHIPCFDKVIEQHFKDGEVIDLTTGQIVSVDRETDDS